MERKRPVFARRPLQFPPRYPRSCAKTREPGYVSELIKHGGNHREPVTARFAVQESGNYAEARRGVQVMSMLRRGSGRDADPAGRLSHCGRQMWWSKPGKRRVMLHRKWLSRQVRMVGARDAHKRSMTAKTRFTKTGLPSTEPRKLTWSEAQGSRTMILSTQRYITPNIDVVLDRAKFEQSDATIICRRKEQ